ncbi:hypothetical protein, partial [Serratia marcescens]|uniref:hypothetical protein n=1 Tax=Serratia marcescens TaxID=615 RepID=UPI001BAF7C13
IPFGGPYTGSTYSIQYRTGERFSSVFGDAAASSPASGIMNAYAGEAVTPGIYTGQISVTGGPYAGSDTTNYTINVLPPLPKCTITPPPLVNFGTHKITQETFIATASTTIQGSCTDSDPADVGKGMYMTFYAGSHGWYDSNSQKLATSLDGIYVTGDSDTPVCSGGNMYFDGQPREDYKVGSIEQAGDKDFSKTLNFALCRDTTKKVAPGAMETSVFVDVVVQ